MADEGDRRRLIDELSESQRVCLSLVSKGYTSKEIARRTGLTPQTVDQYMSKAVAALGVTSRREAARILADALPVQFSKAELNPPTIAQATSDARGTVSPDGYLLPVQTDHEVERTFALNPILSIRELVNLPPVGGMRHAYRWPARLAIIARIALVVVVVVASLLAITRGAVYFLTL